MIAPLDALRIPVIGAPMFIVSGPELVIAQCTSGIVGSFPSLNARPADTLASWIRTVKAALAAHDAAHPERPAAPFAVNLIVHSGNPRLEHDAQVCIDERVPIIITSLRAAPEIVARIHAYGGMVLHDVVNVRHAKRAVADGADGLVAVSAGAGGHAGRLNPFALVAEIREFWDGPLALAGAIGTGRGIAAARALGADFAYVGTRFIATVESRASDAYKAMVLRGAAADITYTPVFSGIHGSYLSESIRAAGLDPENLPETQATLHERLQRQEKPGNEAKAWRDVWSAGQGIGSIHDIPPAATLVERLHAEYIATLEGLHR